MLLSNQALYWPKATHRSVCTEFPACTTRMRSAPPPPPPNTSRRRDGPRLLSRRRLVPGTARARAHELAPYTRCTRYHPHSTRAHANTPNADGVDCISACASVHQDGDARRKLGAALAAAAAAHSRFFASACTSATPPPVHVQQKLGQRSTGWQFGALLALCAYTYT